MTIPPFDPAPDPALVERFRQDAGRLGGDDGSVAVAVSGGADSLALLLLANAAYPGRVHAISVDHGLRIEARDECRFVADLCVALGVPHDIVAVTVRARGKGLQTAARGARYQAFADWCRLRFLTIATAHHMDDQAETILMRAARGAGVQGLSGIAAWMRLPPPTPAAMNSVDDFPAAVIRPLLGWRRAELAEVVRAAGLAPVDDPSNRDERFDRTRFRTLLGATGLLDARRLAATADHCRDADLALRWAVGEVARRHVTADAARYVIDLFGIDGQPIEIMRRLVLDMFAHFGIPLPPGPKVQRMLAALYVGRAATLAGIKATSRDGVWTFTRAPPRCGN